VIEALKEPRKAGWYWFKSETRGLSNPIELELINGEMYILSEKYIPIEKLGRGLWYYIEKPK
jgi:hypothetical protein